MNNLSDKAKALLDYCRENGRFCPQPSYWNQLWELLPDHRQKPSGGWNPPLPLIIAAWWDATGLEKMLRLQEHIRWADEHDAIEQWFNGRD